MALKTIKNVEEETWHEFKTLTVRSHLTMGELLKKMLESYESNSKNFWNEILAGNKILSDKDVEEIKSDIKLIREEHGFRK